MLASNRTHRVKDPMRRNGSIVHLLIVLALACTTVVALGGTSANAGGGIVTTRVVGGLNGPAAFTFLADGRIVYAERGTGQIHIYNPATKSNGRFFTVPGVNGDGERGALGVAVSPGWPHPRAIYVYATRSTSSGPAQPDREGHAFERTRAHARARLAAGQLEPVPQRRPDPVRTRRHALRDRRRRPRQLERPGHAQQPPRQDPAHDARRRRAGRTTRSRASTRSSRSASATRSGSPSTRRQAACGRRRTAPSATTRST